MNYVLTISAEKELFPCAFFCLIKQSPHSEINPNQTENKNRRI